jgi:hypothetical protein
MRERFFFKSAGSAPGSASVSVVPGVDTIEVTGLTPEIIATQGFTGAPGPGVIEVTGAPPVLDLGNQLVPGTDTIEVTGLPPVASFGTQEEAGTDTIEVTGFTPTVDTGGSVVVTPGTDTIEVDGQQPNLDLGHVLVPGVDTIEVTGQQPDIDIGVIVTPGVDDIDVTGLQPDLNIGGGTGFTAEPGTDTIEVDGLQAAVVTTPVNVGVDTIEVTGLQADAYIGQGATISADAGSLTLVGVVSESETETDFEVDGGDIVETVSVVTSGTAFVPAFQPDDLDGLLRWYDAQQLSTVIHSADSLPVESSDSPAKIEEWQDRMGNDDLFAAASTNEPAWIDNSSDGPHCINELPTIVFNGTDEWLRNTAAGSDLDNIQEWTIMAVIRDSGNSGEFFAIMTTNDDYSLKCGTPFGDSDQIAVWNGTTWVGSTLSSTDEVARWMAGQIYDYGTAIRTKTWNETSGSVQSSVITDPGVDTADTILVGARLNTSTGNPEAWFDGGIGEILVWGRRLTPAEIAEVELYFERKWDL